MEEVKICESRCHGQSNSIHNKNAVPIELFMQNGKILKACKDCRVYQNNYTRNLRRKKREKRKKEKDKRDKANARKIIEEEPQFMECDYACHNSISEYPKDKVPIDYFRKVPGNPNSILLKRCKDCRTKISIQAKKDKEEKHKVALENGNFCCVNCLKECPLTNKAVNDDGTPSRSCIKCKISKKERREKNRENYRKIKKEMIIKHQCSCQKCKCIYVKNGESALYLEIYEDNNEKYVDFENKAFIVKDFLEEYIDDLELIVIELDHLSEEEQLERGILGPNEKYIPKKKEVSCLSSENSMRLEALKCQNLCMKCHLEETIDRESKSITKGATSAASRKKKKFINEYKKSLGGCCICEYVNDDLLRFFHMDHIDPEDKSICISQMITMAKYDIEDIKIELEKCRLLCAHCHMIHTQKQRNTGVISTKVINRKSKKDD